MKVALQSHQPCKTVSHYIIPLFSPVRGSLMQRQNLVVENADVHEDEDEDRDMP